MGKRHDEVARRIARQERGEYNPSRGVDVVTGRRAVEVETAGTVSDGLRQLQGHRKPAYIAGTSNLAVNRALEATKRTGVGVTDPEGRIVKRSTRRKT